MTSAQPTSWESRRKSVAPMPGGYGGFLNSLRWVVECLGDEGLTEQDLGRRFAEHYRLTAKASAYRISFLKRTGLIRANSSTCHAGQSALTWKQTGDTTVLIEQIHATTRFVGEMLGALREPRTAEAIRVHCANEQFGMGWTTMTQIDNRRGWLQSAGLVAPTPVGRLALTESGKEFLAAVVIEPPLFSGQAIPAVGTLIMAPTRTADQILAAGSPRESGHESSDPEFAALAPERSHLMHSEGDDPSLMHRIHADSVDTGDPSKFEKTVRDAFEFLGFSAAHLGGSGRTDVLLEARHGLDGYRVAVDAKTTASGKLKDQQVNWAALVEHRRQHHADYSLVVGPKPSGAALMKFARTYEVTVLSADELAELCGLHTDNPLPLAVYRSLFETLGEANSGRVREEHRIANERFELAARVVEVMGELQGQLGELNATSLQVALFGQMEPTPDKTSIQEMLDALASPLIGAIEGSPENGYVLANRMSTTASRLRKFAKFLERARVGRAAESE